MNITILQENLLRALTKTARMVPTKPQLPIIANVLLQTDEGRLKITATNLESTESVWVGARVEKEGGVCVSSRLFLEFVSSLPQINVSLVEKEGTLLVGAGGFHAVFPGMAVGEFPQVGEKSEAKISELAKEEFIRAVSQVVFAAATDEGRPLLTGIRMVDREGETLFAATDGFRLSVKKLRLETGEPLNLLVPSRALSEVVKVSAEEKDVKKIGISRSSSSQLIFTIGDTEIHTRLIDGEYVNFEKIIPAKYNTRVLMEKAVLLAAAKSAAIFARDNANIIKLHIENQTVTVSANTPEVGENSVEIEAKVDGEGGDMALNSRFLLECLANFPGDEVLFEMTGSLNPGVFKSPKDESYLHIIMPVRVQG